MKPTKITIAAIVGSIVLVAAVIHAQSEKTPNPAPSTEQRFLLFQGSYVPLTPAGRALAEPEILRIDTATGKVWSYEAGSIGTNGAYGAVWHPVGG
jgi:hypothetical protein